VSRDEERRREAQRLMLEEASRLARVLEELHSSIEGLGKVAAALAEAAGAVSK